MMFMADLAFATELIAIAAGTALIIWSFDLKSSVSSIAKKSGYFVSFFGLFALLCTTYYSISYWSQGYFISPLYAHQVNPSNNKDSKDSNQMMPGNPAGHMGAYGQQGNIFQGLSPEERKEMLEHMINGDMGPYGQMGYMFQGFSTEERREMFERMLNGQRGPYGPHGNIFQGLSPEERKEMLEHMQQMHDDD